MAQLRIIVSGRVQGVGFRWYVKEKAEKSGLTGYVKNLHNNSVEIVAYGDTDDLERLLDYCRRGPESSRVNDIQVKWDDTVPVSDDFEIL